MDETVPVVDHMCGVIDRREPSQVDREDHDQQQIQEIIVNSKLTFQSVLHENRISKLHLLWNGDLYRNFNILVDLVICAGDVIAKQRRHLFPDKPNLRNQLSDLKKLLGEKKGCMY